MDYVMENDFLKVTVMTEGAQIKSVIRKCDGVEHMWKADPAIWKYHSPTMFPYCARMKDGIMTVDGKTYEAPPHGFAQPMDRKLVCRGEDFVEMELVDSPETLKMWPFRFRLVTRFTLTGDTVRQTLTVENPGQEDMPFGIGYHPGFAIPFDDQHTIEDYEIRFSHLESPLCMYREKDRDDPSMYRLGTNIRSLQVNRKLFERGMAMVNLISHSVSLCEKDSSRRITCDITGVPYFTVWSRANVDPRFVCFEPWYAIDDYTSNDSDYRTKPATEILKPGDSWSATMTLSFER